MMEENLRMMHDTRVVCTRQEADSQLRRTLEYMGEEAVQGDMVYYKGVERSSKAYRNWREW